MLVTGLPGESAEGVSPRRSQERTRQSPVIRPPQSGLRPKLPQLSVSIVV